MQRDYSVGVLLKDMGKVLSVSYAHNIDPTSSVGAEVTKKLEEKEATVFALGCARSRAVRRAAGHSAAAQWRGQLAGLRCSCLVRTVQYQAGCADCARRAV